MLNLSDLARDADVAPNTAKQWLSILQTSGIVHLLEPHHSNVTKRLVKAPKLYLLDTGLGSYLTEWTSPETLEAGAMSGPLLETWVFAELIKKDVDRDRPLSDQGHQDERHLADFLGHAGVQVEQVFHSGKTRAEQTASPPRSRDYRSPKQPSQPAQSPKRKDRRPRSSPSGTTTNPDYPDYEADEGMRTPARLKAVLEANEIGFV